MCKNGLEFLVFVESGCLTTFWEVMAAGQEIILARNYP